MSAEDIKATLEYLVPGFVALKVFYVLGLRTRRSDFGWTVLSIATAAVLNFAVETYGGVTDPAYRTIDAIVLGIVVALVGPGAWRPIAPRWRYLFDRQAWDTAFLGGRWGQVFLKDGPIVLGWPKTVSDSADADEQDVYLVEPSFVDRTTNIEIPIPTVRGIWVPASQIELVEVIAGRTIRRRPADPGADRSTAMLRGRSADDTLELGRGHRPAGELAPGRATRRRSRWCVFDGIHRARPTRSQRDIGSRHNLPYRK